MLQYSSKLGCRSRYNFTPCAVFFSPTCVHVAIVTHFILNETTPKWVSPSRLLSRHPGWAYLTKVLDFNALLLSPAVSWVIWTQFFLWGLLWNWKVWNAWRNFASQKDIFQAVYFYFLLSHLLKLNSPILTDIPNKNQLMGLSWCSA